MFHKIYFQLKIATNTYIFILLYQQQTRQITVLTQHHAFHIKCTKVLKNWCLFSEILTKKNGKITCHFINKIYSYLNNFNYTQFLLKLMKSGETQSFFVMDSLSLENIKHNYIINIQNIEVSLSFLIIYKKKNCW